MEKEIKFRYNTLLNYKTATTSVHHALCEFVDNSIGSWESNSSKDNFEGLIIDIQYRLYSDQRREFVIKDNAFGMDQKTLEEAIQVNDKVAELNNDSMHQYGEGMKLGAFYLGKGLYINTKTNNGKEFTLSVDTEGKKGSDIVSYAATPEADPIVTTKSGTTLKINNLYRALSKDMLTSIEESMGWRYGRHLKNKLKIMISIWKEGEGLDDRVVVQDFKREYFELSKLPGIKTLNDVQEIIRLTKSNIGNSTSKHPEFIDFSEQLINKLENSEPLKFNSVFKFDGVDTPIEWGLMMNKKGKISGDIHYSGVTIFHNNRAVTHGPNKGDSARDGYLGCDQISSGSSGKNNHYRWYMVEFDAPKGQVPDRNKQRIVWTDQGKKDYENFKYKLWTETKQATLTFINAVNEHVMKNRVIPNKTKTKIANGFKASYIKKSRKANVDYEAVLENSTVLIRLHNEKHGGILETNVTESKSGSSKLDVTLNRGHRFWKAIFECPFEQANDVAFSRMALLFAICSSVIDNKKMNFKGIEFDPSNDKMDFMTVLNLISNIVLEDE